jgi:hypothetical protein
MAIVARIAAALAGGLLTVGVANAAVAAPVQTPTETGCPAGYQHLSVTDLEARAPYMAPRAIDMGGNNNGFVCGLPLPAAAAEQACGGPCPVPVVFLFRDDDSPARR